MSQTKKSFLPRIEVLIILVFFASFTIWAVSQCNDTKSLYETASDLKLGEDGEELPVDSSAATSPANTASADTLVAVASASPPAQPAPASPAVDRRTILYVTIDGLKLRSGPSLDSAVVKTLPLFSEVYFLGEVTDSTQKINLGLEVADEPWVKVQNKRGVQGWVYGAGVHYHKVKRKGVQ